MRHDNVDIRLLQAFETALQTFDNVLFREAASEHIIVREVRCPVHRRA